MRVLCLCVCGEKKNIWWIDETQKSIIHIKLKTTAWFSWREYAIIHSRQFCQNPAKRQTCGVRLCSPWKETQQIVSLFFCVFPIPLVVSSLKERTLCHKTVRPLWTLRKKEAWLSYRAGSQVDGDMIPHTITFGLLERKPKAGGAYRCGSRRGSEGWS